MQINKFGKSYKVKWWFNEPLNQKLIVIDTETELITSPALVPNIIVTTAYDGGDSVYLIKNEDMIRFKYNHPNAKFGFWNAAFDIPVLEKLYVSFDKDIVSKKVLDGQILYRLLNIALYGQEAQKWSLDYVTNLALKETIEKDENIRLTFGQYMIDGIVQYQKMTEAHVKYACIDAIATFLSIEKLLKEITKLPTSTNLAHDINLMGDIALAQVTRNGIHIDQKYVEKIKASLEVDKVQNQEILATYGYIKGKKGNTKVLNDICIQQGFNLPVTETGKMCTAKNYLESYKHHPFIAAYLKFKGFSKQQNFLNELDKPIVHPRYNTIKVTTRTSSFSPNIQQLPRIGGIRDCFVAKPDHVFIDCDYSTIELCALSAVCLKLFKFSVMADKINNNADLHKYLASKINKCLESEVTKEQRQFAKIGNFGFGGGMGVETFVSHAAKAGYKLSVEESIKIKEAFCEAYPEMLLYYKRAQGKDTFISDTGFIRANCTYTSYLNCGFQSKTAEGAKLGLYNLIKAGYEVVGFIHDEVLVQCPKELAHETLDKVKEIMIKSMELVVQGVRISVDGKITDKFEK